jgi:hypothetical protein
MSDVDPKVVTALNGKRILEEIKTKLKIEKVEGFVLIETRSEGYSIMASGDSFTNELMMLQLVAHWLAVQSAGYRGYINDTENAIKDQIEMNIAKRILPKDFSLTDQNA